MKKVSEIIEKEYESLNGEYLRKINGGVSLSGPLTDRLCGTGCGSSAMWIKSK